MKFGKSVGIENGGDGLEKRKFYKSFPFSLNLLLITRQNGLKLRGKITAPDLFNNQQLCAIQDNSNVRVDKVHPPPPP